MRNVPLVGGLILAIGCVPGYVGVGRAAKADKTSRDERFLLNALAAGLVEVELGQLASKNGSSSAVRQFGRWMVIDHTKANDELRSLAEIKHIPVAIALEARDKLLYDKLSVLSGKTFDRAYMWAMVRDHEHNLAEFKREAQSGNDPDIRAVASRILGTVEDHLKMADSTDAVVMRAAVKARHRNAGFAGA